MKRYRRVAKPNKKARRPLSEARVAEALRKSGGIITDAARLVGRSQPRISQMVSESDYLKEVREQESEQLLELAKGVIRKHLESDRLNRNSLLAAIYTCKVLGKHEGWSERFETVGVHAHLNADGQGVLLLPQPAHDLNSWEALADQWGRKQTAYDDDDIVDVDIDGDNEY